MAPDNVAKDAAKKTMKAAKGAEKAMEGAAKGEASEAKKGAGFFKRLFGKEA